MATSTIIDEVCSIKWDIVPKEDNANEGHIKEVKDFFDNPNSNYENLKYIFRGCVRDIIHLDSGIINKIFDRGGRLTEIYAKDGGQFTVNPDMFGTFRDKQDFIPIESVSMGNINQMDMNITQYLRDNAAYFQYAMVGGGRMVPFGKREIVYMKRNPLTNSMYGWSPIQSLSDVLNSLIYAVQHNKEQFTEDTIPKGFVQMTGANIDDIKDFKSQWVNQMRRKDKYGNWLKNFFKIPIVGSDAKFVRLGWTNEELQLITQQQWFSKLVWGSLGVPPSELGFTEDSNRAVGTTQKKVIRRRTVLPILDLLEYSINSQIIPEFGYEDIKFQFNREDNDEEREKSEIYEKQIKAGFRTINEIREERGDKPIDGGDKIKQNTFNPFSKFGENGEEQTEKEKEKPEEKKSFKSKLKLIKRINPFETPEEKKSFKNYIKIKRFNPFEKPKEEVKFLEYPIEDTEITSILKKNIESTKKEMYEIIEKAVKRNQILEIKSLDNGQIENITKLLGLATIEETLRKSIYGQFMKGLEEAGKEMDRNFLPDTQAVSYLQDYTFDNVKDLNEELKNKLRGELQRGIMNGEGASGLKERVNKVLEVGERRSELIARTETMRASNFGRLDGYQQSGIEGKKEWVCSMDARSCALCKSLNGQKVNLNENFKYKGGEINIPPLHPSGRCRIVFKPD